MKEFEELKVMIKKRNLREWMACALVCPLFFYRAINTESTIEKLFLLEISIAALFIAYYIFSKSHRGLKGKIENTTELNTIVENEINISKNIRYWYILPIYIGVVGLISNSLYVSYIGNKSMIGPATALVFALVVVACIIYLNENKGVKDLKRFLV